MLQRLFTAYAVGSLAALVVSLALWIAARADLVAAIAAAAPAPTLRGLAPRLVLGGLFALPFPLLPARMSPVRRGLLLSLLPSAATLLRIVPERGLDDWTVVVVVAANAVWGWLLGRTWSAVAR